MAKLNRDEILHELLKTLVDGWGQSAVQAALDGLCSPVETAKRKRARSRDKPVFQRAVDLVEELKLPPDRDAILTELARRFDEGSAFPKIGDARSFLLSHHRNGTDLKGRIPAFKRMLPVLVEMSPKGLERLLARSHHSGPADLGEISDAIKGAGENLRGGGKPQGERDATRSTHVDGAALEPQGLEHDPNHETAKPVSSAIGPPVDGQR
ncbi:hypothetical protein [Sphingomonas sp.]|uniref:hypothetical protein n=1 Tax=Sphingomonas sp. TaxID=28214 RepID=UPI003F6EE913